MAEHFNVILHMFEKERKQNVHFKPDGQRFSDSTTIKFNTNTIYTTKVSIRPRRKLSALTIHGVKSELVEETEPFKEATFGHYATEWNTQEFEVTKGGKRKELHFEFEFDNTAMMKCVLQAKFYPEKEIEHCRWGSELMGIDYECSLPEGGRSVHIINRSMMSG